MDILSITLQLILSLSILVVLHECGHFFPAKWFKTKVEKFYLFFDPWFSLVKKKIGDTEYGIGWIPFGGYVKIAGMIDESMDKEQMKQPEQPWEFRAKPAWQRLIIMIGGVVVNVLLGILIFSMLLYVYGKPFYTNDQLKYGLAVDSIGMSLGLRNGDVLIKAGDVAITKYPAPEFTTELLLNKKRSFTVLRDGEKITYSLIDSQVQKLAKGKMFSPRFPAKIMKIAAGSAAEKGGMKVGDAILSVDGKPSAYINEFVQNISSSPNKTVAINVLRGVDTVRLNIAVNDKGKTGVEMESADSFLTKSKTTFSLGNAFGQGAKDSWDFIAGQVSAFKLMFSGDIKPKDSLGSVFSMAKMFDPSWNWESFWRITGMLSLVLAFFNILPIPALDGGYVIFLLYEVISGRKPSDRFMEIATTVGFFLLISLMIFALGLDISRLFK